MKNRPSATRSAPALGLRAKLFLSYLGLATLAVSAVGAMTVLTERQALQAEITANQKQLVQRLAKICEESLLENPLVFFNYGRTLRTERGFREAGFADSEGVIRFHTDPKRMYERFDSPRESTLNAAPSPSETLQSYPDARGRLIVDWAAPIFLGHRRVGTARLLLDKSEIDRFLDQSLVNNLKRVVAITVGVLLVSWLVAWTLARATVRPIERVIQGMRAISEGQRTPIPFPPRRDELGWMGDELNATIKRLRELDEMKEDFVAGVTHDLKSPLKAIQSFVTRLFDNLGQYSLERQRDYLLIVNNNAGRLMDLIDDLLTTARLEAGREELDFSNLDFGELLREGVKLFQPLAQEKKLTLSADLPAMPVRAWADHAKLAHVLSNLISNAVKYTEEGSVVVSLGGTANEVEIRVSDTGSGIPAGDRDRIFEKFFRSKTNAGLAKGTGLGLYIVKGIVEAHRGAISVAPNSPRGTVFTVTLPVSLPE